MGGLITGDASFEVSFNAELTIGGDLSLMTGNSTNMGASTGPTATSRRSATAT